MEYISTILTIIGWPTIVVLAYRFGTKVAAIQTTLTDVTVNHIPHIYDELKEIRTVLMKG